jgi:hypothetical protein
MKKPYLIIFILIIIISFGAGLFLGKNILGKSSDKDCATAYQDGWNAMRDRIIKSGKIQLEDQVYSFLGDVYKKTDTELFITPSYIDPLLSPDLDSRIVKVNTNTVIYQMTKKDNAQYQQEMTDFVKSNPNRGPDGTGLDGGQDAPSMFVKDTRTFNEILVGQRITVKADENIIEKNEFTAKEIVIQ